VLIQKTLVNAVASGGSPSIISDPTAILQARQKALDADRIALKAANDEYQREKQLVEQFMKDSEVVQFNVGGEHMFTTRASLLRVKDSRMGQILLNTSLEKVSKDVSGNHFFDFNPSLFRHLLEQLRLFEDGEPVVFYPPLTPVLATQFNAMLKKLGLKPAPESDDDIFTFNVGDEIVATKRKTLKRIPKLLTMNKPSDMDPTGKPFLDYDPKLFRHLLTQIQGGQTTSFEAPSDDNKAAFNAMLKNLGLTPKN
jgi:hypothetical protein